MSVFDNPYAEAAIRSLTPEQKEHYRKIGEEMYSTIDYKEAHIQQNAQPNLEEAAEYIISGIKSGLHPNELDANEKLVLSTVYGDEWYLQYGYTEEDLDKINMSEK